MLFQTGILISLGLFLSSTSASAVIQERGAKDGFTDEIRIGGLEKNLLCDNNGIFFLEQMRKVGKVACRKQERLDCSKNTSCSRSERFRNSIIRVFSKPKIFEESLPKKLDEKRPLLMERLKLGTKLKAAHKYFVVVDWNSETSLCSVVGGVYHVEAEEKFKTCDQLSLDDKKLKDNVFRIKLGLKEI